MIEWILWGVVVVLTLLSGWVGWRWRTAVGQVKQATEQLVAASAELEASAKSMRALKQEFERLKPLFETHRGMNEQFEKERNEAWALYRRSSTESMNGHAMLLRELERLQILVNGYREKAGEPAVKINPAIAGFMEAFKESHT